MKIKVIINPFSLYGRKKNLETILRDHLPGCRVDIQETMFPKHAAEISRQAVEDRYDTIVAVGGDGTVNEIVNGVIGTDTVLGIIPTGTANDLASFYHIPTDIARASDVILAGYKRHIDVIQVNGRYYVTAGGLGFSCDVVRIANRIKSRGIPGRLIRQSLGSKLYFLALLIALIQRKNTHNPVEILMNGNRTKVDPLLLMVDNQPFVGRNFLVSPGAVNDDGLFDICLALNSRNRLEILSIVLKVLSGKHTALNTISMSRSEELIITAEKPLAFFGDGEILEQASEFRICIVPAGLRLIVPPAYQPSSRNVSERSAEQSISGNFGPN